MAAVTATSCKKDFIALEPKDSYSAGTFFQNEDQLRQGVMAAYVPLRDLLVNDYFTSEMRSDNTIYQAYPSNRGTAYLYRESISDFTNNPNNSYSNAVYFHSYKGISRANIVLGRINDVTLSPEAKADIEGQAKFIRAWNYFKLVRHFGGVPLFLKEVTKADEAFLVRSTAEEVYAQLIADAKDAITLLAPPAGFPQSGKATKGAATMLLAEVYATQKKWAEAEALLNTLPAMGYALHANYADVFSTANKNSKESIFEVQYLEGTAVGTAPNNFIYQFLPRTNSTELITGTKTNNGSTGGWNTPTKDLIDAYEANDKRLDASIAIAEGAYNASDLLVISANKSIVNYIPGPGKTGVPYIKKYLNLPHQAPNNAGDNWPIYRYAGALLLLAEVQNEQGKSPFEALNAVRTRAGLPAVNESNQAALRGIIAHERRIELAFENHRWHDLQRTGKAVEVMNAFGTNLKQQVNYLSADAYQVTPDKLLFPIPQSERELNPALVQNPGYF
ncbi:RagB/SusD family nutrient uptake outer membrane protein [Pedobacter immunditicola]|uniref:RagB/SusD family nutrient uptake outer membrane protein n=1 Tax=Pedobacter immunditicola TaxID=3133440 RepID=UPI00309BD63D